MKSFNHLEGVYNDESASEIVPLLIRRFKPKSVIDIGCGIGNFLKIFKNAGVSDFVGVDGSWVDKEKLRKNISLDKFINLDIEIELEKFSGENENRYDLLISLEVAEHLSEEIAEIFVKNLCRLSDTIVFSAAIPLQGGENHINEQWPSYLIKLFNKNDFSVSDEIRKEIWGNNKIHWWYRQNIMLFTKMNSVETCETNMDTMYSYDRVHPEMYLVRSKAYIDLVSGKISLGYLFLIAKKIFKKKFR